MFTKLSHIGIMVNDIEKAKKSWTETFGLKVSPTRVVAVEGLKQAFLSIGDSFIELIEPIDHQDMGNMVAKRLATRGEGIFHIALIVDDITKVAKELTTKGLEVIKRPPTSDQPQGRLILHPKSTNGALLELMSRELTQ